MDKKKLLKTLTPDDLKGFEEFIQDGPQETNFLPRGVGGSNKKNEVGFEHFTFLSNDAERLAKLKELLGEKLPFAGKFDQSAKLIKDQKEELEKLKLKLFLILDKPGSSYRKSLAEVFDAFFGEGKS